MGTLWRKHALHLVNMRRTTLQNELACMAIFIMPKVLRNMWSQSNHVLQNRHNNLINVPRPRLGGGGDPFSFFLVTFLLKLWKMP